MQKYLFVVITLASIGLFSDYTYSGDITLEDFKHAYNCFSELDTALFGIEGAWSRHQHPELSEHAIFTNTAIGGKQGAFFLHDSGRTHFYPDEKLNKDREALLWFSDDLAMEYKRSVGMFGDGKNPHAKDALPFVDMKGYGHAIDQEALDVAGGMIVQKVQFGILRGIDSYIRWFQLIYDNIWEHLRSKKEEFKFSLGKIETPEQIETVEKSKTLKHWRARAWNQVGHCLRTVKIPCTRKTLRYALDRLEEQL